MLNPEKDARSGLKQLQSLVDSKLRTLIWVGHAMLSRTWTYMGSLRLVTLTSSTYALINH